VLNEIASYLCAMKTHEIYQLRIAAAVEYINLHLDEELELADIAAVAHFSPFHFHRIFKAFRGEPLGSYITRLRVETAAQLLRHSDLPVETIAYNVGFGVPTSLNRAFRALYDTTPTEYRSTKNIHIMKTPQINPSVKLKAPKIVELEPRSVICLSLVGEYSGLDFGAAFARLWAEVKAQKLFTAGIEHICIYHDDPKSTDPARLRTDVCLVVHKPAVASGEVGVKTIPDGRYAVFTHTGPYNEVGVVYDAIFGQWVPENCTCGDDCQCGDDCRCALRDEPVFEKYCNDPATTAPEKLKTEIYIPIK
jgi:AraC family transcriptional regulator